MSDIATTTGTATSRARQVRRAIRRQTRARLALSGPSGAGKTWTALSLAAIIAPGKPVVVIDTEPGDGSQGAAELYADQFDFDTIQWDPPYDPRDLTATIRELGREYAEGVGIIDSASHFWRGEGGTLDIADGRFGGWKSATPAQDQMVDAILRSSMHWIVCTRAKQAYEVNETVSNGQKKQTVQKLGLAPIQRDDLEYEFQVVAMIDTEHRIDIGKTRAAPLAGLSFQANDQGRFGEIYHEWLQGGAELPRQVELDALLQAIKQVPDAKKVGLKQGLREQFGPMTSLTIDQMPGVWNAVRATLEIDPHPFRGQQAGDGVEICEHCSCLVLAGWHDDSAPEPAAAAPAAPAEPDPGADTPEDPPEAPQEPSGGESDALGDAFPGAAEELDTPPADVQVEKAEGPVNLADYEAQLVQWADGLEGADLQAELEREGLPLSGRVADRRHRLVLHLVAKASTEAGANPDLAPGEEPF